MAEVLFWGRDRIKTWDAELNEQAYKLGDAIAIKPDGWPWSQIELTKPEWRIVRFTRITDVNDLNALLVPEMLGTQLKRKRARFIDRTKLPTVVQTWLNDDTRVIPIFETNVPQNTVLNYITTKTPRTAPFRVFG